MCKVVECTYVEWNSMCRYIHSLIAWTSITHHTSLHHTFRVLTNPQFFSSVFWSVHYSGSTNWVQDWSNFLIWLQFKGRSWYKNQQFIYQDSKLLLSYSLSYIQIFPGWSPAHSGRMDSETIHSTIDPRGPRGVKKSEFFSTNKTVKFLPKKGTNFKNHQNWRKKCQKKKRVFF